MAGGYRCRHCGWQETTHGFVGEDTPIGADGSEIQPDLTPEEMDTKKEGYDFALNTCPGYSPEKEDAKAERAEAKLAEEDEKRRKEIRDERTRFD